MLLYLVMGFGFGFLGLNLNDGEFIFMGLLGKSFLLAILLFYLLLSFCITSHCIQMLLEPCFAFDLLLFVGRVLLNSRYSSIGFNLCQLLLKLAPSSRLSISL